MKNESSSKKITADEQAEIDRINKEEFERSEKERQKNEPKDEEKPAKKQRKIEGKFETNEVTGEVTRVRPEPAQ